MTIYKAKTLIDTYRYKAKSNNIHELNGRPNRPDLTDFIAEEICKKIRPKDNSVLLDIGCGDATLLKKLASSIPIEHTVKLLGVLPTREELIKVKENLFADQKIKKNDISIMGGRAEALNLPDSYCDYIICNSVLHGSGQTLENVNSAIKEFSRISKVGCQLYIGEIPDSDEMKLKNYGESLTAWLVDLYRKNGAISFLKGLKSILVSLLTKEPFVIVPKFMFYMKPNEFQDLLRSHGFQVETITKHLEINVQGRVLKSNTRWNYQAIRVTL